MAAASSMEYASRSVVADGSSGFVAVFINSALSGFAAGGERCCVKELARIRRQAALLVVNEAAKRLVNRFAQVQGGDESDRRNAKYEGENLDLIIVDVNQPAFDFGEAATRDPPTGLLEPVGQFILGPAALVAELVDQSSRQIQLFHANHHIARLVPCS